MRIEAAAVAAASLSRPASASSGSGASFADLLAEPSDRSAPEGLFSFDELGVLGAGRGQSEPPSRTTANSKQTPTADALLQRQGGSQRSTSTGALGHPDRPAPSSVHPPETPAVRAAAPAGAPPSTLPAEVPGGDIDLLAANPIDVAKGGAVPMQEAPASPPWHEMSGGMFARVLSESLDGPNNSASEAAAEASQHVPPQEMLQSGRAEVAASSETSVIVAGQGGLVQVVTASPDMPPEARVRLRQLADEVSAEFGMKVSELSVNGKIVEPAPSNPRSFT